MLVFYKGEVPYYFPYKQHGGGLEAKAMELLLLLLLLLLLKRSG
jgi:hypothetical protein